MKLVGFSVEDYRSITGARKIQLSNYSVLIGPNNEGKSNILHALSIGMDVLAAWHRDTRKTSDGKLLSRAFRPTRNRTRASYDWDRDYPIGKQNNSNGETRITLEFSLSGDEVVDFENEIGSKLNGTLPIVATFGRDTQNVQVQKPGRGSAVLNKKSARITDFVSRRIRFAYIPTIRTAEIAMRVISNLIDGELRRLERDQEYRTALESIQRIQKPVLDNLSNSLRETVSSFLPSVKRVDLILNQDDNSRFAYRNFDVVVDDGQKTSLERKGDGVQSLVALALMKDAFQSSADSATTIIAIEEPESHLHPKAIHELQSVIEELASTSQVVLTSHSPLFVRTNRLENTVIVENSKARCARQVAEIREVLGVRFSDNLHNARLILLVEGQDDVRSLLPIVSKRSKKIEQALRSGEIAFDHLSGASALSYKASQYKSAACQVQCFLDNDSAGTSASNKAIESKSITIADFNLCTVPGLNESELEDMFDLKSYSAQFFTEFGVDLTRKVHTSKGKKWSDRTGIIFKASGKPWDGPIKGTVKTWLSNFAANNPDNIINKNIDAPLQAFIESVELKLQ